ncbi:hypothetical protein ACFOOK_12145 [Micromonospora krabiensis]|uniref:hypothetical protein n=1 Tax=Micromonospora krabiensis TaxID=307121 RepID=UPI0012FDFCD7|nr:hypothetical protein [Micromonospora krabiensis]
MFDYAAQTADTIGTPLVSRDIGFDGAEFHLVEFQCLHFGTVTAEESTHYHVCDSGEWRRIEERCDIEAVFAEAIAHYLAR